MAVKLNFGKKKAPAKTKGGKSATSKLKAALAAEHEVEEEETEEQEEEEEEEPPFDPEEEETEPAPKTKTKAKGKGGINISTAKAKAKTTVKQPDDTEEEEEEEVGDPIMSSEPLYNVGVKLGRTLNLGEYESARVEVSLHIPCAAEDVEESYEAGLAWVNSKVMEIIEGAAGEEEAEEEAED